MSEALRKALADGDHLAAAYAIFDATSGDYDADTMDEVHRVGRMSRAQLQAPPEPEPAPREQVRVTTRIFGWWRS